MAKARKRTNTRTTAKTEKINVRLAKTPAGLRAQNWLEQLKLSESYVSLLLGAVVVVVLSAVFFVFIRESGFKNISNYQPTNQAPTSVSLQNPRTYVLKEGEGLWDVAVKFYGDGYKWVDIANANNLTEEQANALGPGTRIILPNLK